MSRRESRVSMNVRQNDALFELRPVRAFPISFGQHTELLHGFTVKKKFLLANKHITKLNSTLSMKIEELNTEISTLYTENLRLRASEIALAAQLKREREKSRKILSDAEAATTYANNVNRLAREPQVSNINEDEEPEDVQASPPRKAKKKARLSATPPIAPAAPSFSAPAPPPHLDLSLLALPTKKRRQSGLLLDLGVVDIDALDFDDGADETDAATPAAALKPKPRLKDVTNSNPPRPRSKADSVVDAVLPPLPLETHVQARSFLVAAPPEPPPPEPKALPVPPQIAVVPQPKQPQAKPARARGPSLDSTSDRDRDQRRYAVEPVTSTAAAIAAAEAETEAGGRERRTRKSVNYAEPKLNTKMRKPEPPAGLCAHTGSGKEGARECAPARPPPLGTTSTRPGSLATEEPDEDEPDEKGTEGEGDEEDSDVWADGEYIPGWASGHVNVEGRRKAPHGHRGRRKGEVDAAVGDWARERERDARRHSAAV
ncbi:hypothetical protein B0H14DRAFT_2837481 [Mycena olivaceomarginata]|nr:hypothetical protein B0H14DRAFT_2837481 [Mycena olivaceomarginata]